MAWAVRRLGIVACGSEAAGWVVVGLLLATRAGNIGTNHLFEPMLLDRLMAMALGWAAIGEVVLGSKRAPWTVALLTAAAQVIHPALGLQLGLLLAVGWLTMGVMGRRLGIDRRTAIAGAAALALVLGPALVRLPAQSATLLAGLPSENYHSLAALVQSPQHLVPSLWRWEQWMSWSSLIAMGTIGLAGGLRGLENRRLLALLAIVLVGLAAAFVGIERLHDLRITLFQPFRMATVARGLALVGLTSRIVTLWRGGTWFGQARAGLLVGGLTGEWAFVVVAGVELAATLGEWIGTSVERARRGLVTRTRWIRASSIRPDPIGLPATLRLSPRQSLPWAMAALALAFGLWWLDRHDTREGQGRLLAGVAAGVLAGLLARRLGRIDWSRARCARLAAYAWLVPLASLGIGLTGWGLDSTAGIWLSTHLRLTERPIDDEERLGAWCHAHLPAGARLIGPPGPKGLRLWSRRPVMFNRASSPYHAAGLADWARRYCDHVGLPDSPSALAAAYLSDRHKLEARYDDFDGAALAKLARRQGADHVVAREGLVAAGLARLHGVGALAVYRVF